MTCYCGDCDKCPPPSPPRVVEPPPRDPNIKYASEMTPEEWAKCDPMSLPLDDPWWLGWVP